MRNHHKLDIKDTAVNVYFKLVSGKYVSCDHFGSYHRLFKDALEISFLTTIFLSI